jgi:hypothetical protein
METKTLSTYVRPEIEVCDIETSSVLATSGDPSITNPSLGWDTEDDDIS